MKQSKTVTLIASETLKNKQDSPTHVSTQKPNITMLKKRHPLQNSKPAFPNKCRVVQSDLPIVVNESATINSRHNETDQTERAKMNRMYTIDNSTFFKNAAMKFKTQSSSVLERPMESLNSNQINKRSSDILETRTS